jgi:hypothetical protein
MPRQTNLIGFLFVMLLVVYVMPWLVNPGVALTGNAIDLAAWATLHPQPIDKPSPMLTALLLRLPLVLITWSAAFYVGSQRLPHLTWRFASGTLLVLILVIANFPPIEFFTSEPENANYQQQAVLFALALAGSIIGLSGVLKRISPYLVGFSLLGIIPCAVLGVLQARDLMIGFSMPVSLGIGAFGTVGVALLMGLIILQSGRLSSRPDY